MQRLVPQYETGERQSESSDKDMNQLPLASFIDLVQEHSALELDEAACFQPSAAGKLRAGQCCRTCLHSHSLTNICKSCGR